MWVSLTPGLNSVDITRRGYGKGTMPENTAPATPEPTETPTPIAFAAPASQEELDRIIGERVARERAKYADYKELQERVAAADNANKTELELAEATIAELRTSLLNTARQAAAARHGIADEYVDLLSGDTPEAIEAVAAKLGALAKPVPVEPVPVEPVAPGNIFDPAQSGATSPDEAAVREAFARQLFGV